MIQALFIQGFFICSQLRQQKRKEILTQHIKINNNFYHFNFIKGVLMKKANFALLPLAVFIAANVQAEEQLDVINVVSENSGAKSKTNVITTKTMERSTETELKGLLKDEPAINFGGGRGTSQ